MRISQRLFLAVVPAIIGVFTVAGLAYWGAFHRAAPGWVIVVASVSAVGSLVLAWQNTRYVARRIERLAGDRARPASTGFSAMSVVRSALPRMDEAPDELDSIEQVVDHLSSAVAVAEAGSRDREKAAAERIQEYAVLLDEASAAVRRHLNDARIALHILLEGHFGGLNVHQDEMVEAAQAGTDAAEDELARLQQIGQLDRAALHLRREAVRIGDVLQSLRPQLEADAVKAGVTISMDVMPGLPRALGDRIRLQQALEFLLRHIVRHATPGAALSITADSDHGAVRIAVIQGRPPTLDADVALARRIIDAHGGRIDINQLGTTVTLPTGGAR